MKYVILIEIAESIVEFVDECNKDDNPPKESKNLVNEMDKVENYKEKTRSTNPYKALRSLNKEKVKLLFWFEVLIDRPQ